MGKKKKKKIKIFKDDKGEYIRNVYFEGGKRKFIKTYVINGQPVDEFYEQNTDPITLFQNGDYVLLENKINKKFIK